jgi:hypothetical protein
MSFEINFYDQSRPKLQFCLLTACQTEQGKVYSFFVKFGTATLVTGVFVLVRVWMCASMDRNWCCILSFSNVAAV